MGVRLEVYGTAQRRNREDSQRRESAGSAGCRICKNVSLEWFPTKNRLNFSFSNKNFIFRENQRDSTLEITSKGFQFLLMDRTSQLWIYLLNYLKYLEVTEFLSKFFRIGQFFVSSRKKTQTSWSR